MAAAFKAVAGAFGASNAPQQGPPNWQSEHFACMDDTNVCIQTACCSWCTESNLIMMRERNTPELDPMTCLGACCFDVITRGIFSASIAFALRRELIQRYGIQEEPYCTSALHNICVPCNLCQIQREMAKRGEHPGGLIAKPPAQQGGLGQKLMGAAAAGAMAVGVAPWGSTLFQCAGAEDCVDSCCCAPCTLAFVSNRLDAGRSSLIPANVENKMDPATCCGAYCCMPAFHMAVRRELIDRYQITEPHLVSFAFAMFCSCCSLAQLRREMGYRGEWPSGMILKDAPARVV